MRNATKALAAVALAAACIGTAWGQAYPSRTVTQIVPESKQTPAGLRDWLRSEIDKWQPVIRKAGVYAD